MTALPAADPVPAPAPGAGAPLTIVTVVFEPEVPLLRLQARSFARFLDPDSLAQLLVLDNCAGGMRAGQRRRVLAELGSTLAARTHFLRTADLGVEVGSEGWRSQQAAKLLVARRIPTAHYVIFDAKLHLIAPASALDFVDAAGRVRSGSHPYTEHPLRGDLERTLRYLGADEQTVDACLGSFPQTHTPFVVDTDIARRMLDDIERTSSHAFGDEFERARLLEFFLYSSWSLLRGDGLPLSGETAPSWTIWPGKADDAHAADIIRDVRESDALWFGVHRRVFVRSSPVTRDRIAAFWVERGLMDAVEAHRFVRRFRAAYVPRVARARIAERLSRLRRR